MDHECHGLDTPARVCFYEQDFYVLSNFSAFTIVRYGIRFDTLEHLYHWEKFNYKSEDPARNFDLASIREYIRVAPSAHEAFQLGQRYRLLRRPDWDDEDEHGITVKEHVMFSLLMLKCDQHEYVERKLLSTGYRELVENSWRDDFWGWGPNKNGLNKLGKLWMNVRVLRREEETAHR